MLRRALRGKDIAWNGWFGRPIMDRPMCVTPRSDAQANKNVPDVRCALFTLYWEILSFFFWHRSHERAHQWCESWIQASVGTKDLFFPQHKDVSSSFVLIFALRTMSLFCSHVPCLGSLVGSIIPQNNTYYLRKLNIRVFALSKYSLRKLI